jgi:hypothetical protein
MVTSRAELSTSRWTLRDWIAGAVLFAATASVVLWQNAHVAILYDLSYVLDTAARIAAGQIPYRDFPLVHPPLTFLTQAAIIQLTGRVYFHHVLYVAAAGGLTTVLTWRIALNTLREKIVDAWTLALLMVAPLTVLGIYCIQPNPEYDSDCALWTLVAIWFLQRVDAKENGRVSSFAAGAFVCLPLFFKQNMGLPFLLVVVAAVLAALAFRTVNRVKGPEYDRTSFVLLWMLAGVGAFLTLAVTVLHWTAGVSNYLHWTIWFAGQRRMPALGAMLGVYSGQSMIWTLPCIAVALVILRSKIGNKSWARIASFLLLAGPFLFTLSSLLLYRDADDRGDSLLALWPLLLILAAALAVRNLFTFRREPAMRLMLPLILLAAINGTLMSQQLWGSTYAIWPLLILLLADLLAFLETFAPHPIAAKRLTPALAALISCTLLICGGFYTASEERLSYARLPDEPVQHSAFPQLAGMTAPGPYLPEFDELLRYADTNIPFNDGLILIPGEDPFYFATGRVPRFPVLLFDPTTDPYSPDQIASLVRERNIRWLVVKHDLQIDPDPTPARTETLQALMPEFMLAAHLRAYDVYRR